MPFVTPSTSTAARWTGKTTVVAALLVTVALLTGCGRGADSGTTSGGAPQIGAPADRDAVAGDEAVGGGAPEGAPPGGDVQVIVPPDGLSLGQQIVRTGDISVDVDDITSTANRVTALVDAAGGEIGSDQRQGDATDGTADFVLRVPPDSFDDVLDTISALGEELSRTVSADDVSTVVADVDARVQSLQNSVNRLLALAGQAVSVSDLIVIESELSARQAELESLQAQQRALADQVSLATLTVRLSASSDPADKATGFLASLEAGWNALLYFGAGLISLVGVLLPWLAVVALIGIPAVVLWRRRRSAAREATAAEVPVMATFGPAPAEVVASTGQSVSAPAGNEPARPPE